MSILVKIRCNGENINFIRKPTITSGDKNVVRCKFCFDSTWDGYTKTAIFTQNNSASVSEPITNDECIIPYTVLSCKCKLYIGVIGVKDNKRLTTRLLAYDVVKGAGEDSSVSPTPDQINAAIKCYVDGQDFATKTYVDSKQCVCDPTKIKNAVDSYAVEKNLADKRYVNDTVNSAIVELKDTTQELTVVLDGGDSNPETHEDDLDLLNVIFDGGQF